MHSYSDQQLGPANPYVKAIFTMQLHMIYQDCQELWESDNLPIGKMNKLATYRILLNSS